MNTALVRIGVIVLAGLAALRCGGSSDVDALRSELALVKEDLANLRASLGRPRATVALDGVRQRGNPEAQVALLEFSDYECPFCRRHFSQTMPLIEQQYIATGKILYAFRDFPIDELHPQAIKAHEAAQCGLEQGRFWQMHTLLFGTPEEHAPDGLEATAAKAGLNLDEYRECIASGRTTAAIRETVDQATSFGANGTPAFFVGFVDAAGKQITVAQAMSGALPFETFAKVLDAALAQVNPKD